MAKSFYEQKCRICGCDWNHACNDHDYWFAVDLCSACAEAMKPVLFNTPMVQAILDNRKTNTRRVIKPQPPHDDSLIYRGMDDIWFAEPRRTAYGAKFERKQLDGYCAWEPPYHPDDILYVRETWGIGGFNPESSEMFVEYKADGATASIVLPEEKFQKYYEGMSEAEPDWHPSIHMPKEAARIFLRVIGVRAERLHDITENGAIAEGLISTAKMTPDGLDYSGLMAYDQFHPLWDSTVKKADLPLYGWDANPWVWAYKFKRIGNGQTTETA